MLDYDKLISGEIDKDEFLIINIINQSQQIELTKILQIIKNNDKTKRILNKLEKEKKIKIEYENNLIKTNKIKQNNKIEQPIVTVEQIDQIKVIINREIKPYELEKILEWRKNYSIKTITDAIYKAATKNIDNFNYIEKIIINNQEESNNNNSNSTPNNLINREYNFWQK